LRCRAILRRFADRRHSLLQNTRPTAPAAVKGKSKTLSSLGNPHFHDMKIKKKALIFDFQRISNNFLTIFHYHIKIDHV